MLSCVFGNQHLQKTKKHSFSLSKKIANMKLWSLLALNGRSLSSKEAEKTASSSHKQDFVLNSKVGLSSAMKNTDINGLYKIWTRNHTVVTLKCEVNR